MSEWYYKIINISTGDDYYAKCNLPIKADRLCDIVGLEGYRRRINIQGGVLFGSRRRGR